LPYYLPHWSGRQRSAARYEAGGGRLRLLIEGDQQPRCPELDGEVKVSSLQTGEFAGAVGSLIGQHRFTPGARVREAQRNVRPYTPRYGRFELGARASDDPEVMVAFWMIGYEDEPTPSAEICVCEIFGRDVTADSAMVGVGVHPFADPRIADEFTRLRVPIDARERHLYAAEWTPEGVLFLMDGEPVKSVAQSPGYPMQLMVSIYEFPGGAGGPSKPYPKGFIVESIRGYRLR
jgi:hypothetical protein